MEAEPPKVPTDSEVFRFGGFGTALLISLLVFIGLYPLMLGNVVARLAGGLILAMILVSAAIIAGRSRTHRLIGVVLALASVGLQIEWLVTHKTTVEALHMGALAAFLMYTALVIFRHVLSFGPVYADRVHAALSVYILFALAWACIYALIEIVSPGAFSLGSAVTDAQSRPQGAPLLGHMIHFSIATLTSTGYGDITPIAPLARSLSQLEQLAGIFYIAVLISRLVGLYPENTRV
jgi:hypothetical protein